MQVEVSSNGLERRLTIAVPSEKYDLEVESRLKSLSKRIKVDGFRAGKVPFKVVQQRWGGSVRQEVLNDLVQSSFYEAISQEKLRPAGLPQFEVLPEAPGAGLKYTAVFEVYPEFEFKLPKDMQIDRPSSEINEADIDKMVEKLRKQRQGWVSVSRPAQQGDRVIMDFRGTVNGEEFAGNTAKDYAVVIGSGNLIPSFEKKLVGLKPDQPTGIDVEFPKDYRAENLAGQVVHFDVTVHQVSEPKLPELNDEFFASFGVKEGGEPVFRTEVKASMTREAEQAVKDNIKQQVMDVLIAANPIPLPKALVDQEIERITAQTNLDNVEGLERALEERARRRVALGLIIAEVVRVNQFKAAPDKVRAAVDAVAATYEDPAEVVKWYYAQRERLGNVEALVLEDQAVDWIVKQAVIREQSMPFEELVNARKSVA